MISSDESSSDDGGFKEWIKSSNEHKTTELQGKKNPSQISQTVKTQSVCEIVQSNPRNKKKMCKSDFIKSNTESSIDSDNLLDISVIKKQKLKKRRSNNLANPVHSPQKKKKAKDVSLDESCSSLSENEEPSTSQRKRKRKIKHKILNQSDSDEYSDRESNEVDKIGIQHLQNLDDDGMEEENSSDIQEDEFVSIKSTRNILFWIATDFVQYKLISI